MEIIVGRKGEQPFLIADKSVSSKHVKLTTLPDGKVQIEDLGSSNGTFVDGVRIVKKVVDRTTIIRLGSSYTLKISDVLPEAPKAKPVQHQGAAVAVKKVPEYSISHLQVVWDEYDETLAAIKDRSQQMAKKRMIPMMLGSVSGLISAFVGPGAFITIPIAIASFYILYKTYKEKDTSHEDTKAAKELLIKKYVCPNPQCHRTLPLQDFAVVSQSPACPHCKCKWTLK